MTPTPTTDSAVSPVRELSEVQKHLILFAEKIGPLYVEDIREFFSNLPLTLSRRSLDTADGVALSALKTADELLTAEAENRGDVDEDYEANVGPALAKVRAAITTLASPPSPAEVTLEQIKEAERLARQLRGRAGSEGARSYTQRMAEDDQTASEIITVLLASLQLNKKD